MYVFVCRFVQQLPRQLQSFAKSHHLYHTVPVVVMIELLVPSSPTLVTLVSLWLVDHRSLANSTKPGHRPHFAEVHNHFIVVFAFGNISQILTINLKIH